MKYLHTLTFTIYKIHALTILQFLILSGVKCSTWQKWTWVQKSVKIAPPLQAKNKNVWHSKWETLKAFCHRCSKSICKCETKVMYTSWLHRCRAYPILALFPYLPIGVTFQTENCVLLHAGTDAESLQAIAMLVLS